VDIGPAGAVTAGAKWRRVDTDAWREAGSVESGVDAGTHRVEFNDVDGWVRPSIQTALIRTGEMSSIIAVYQQDIACEGEAIAVWMMSRNAMPGAEILIPINVSSAEVVSPAGIQIEATYDPEFLDPDTVEVQSTAITGRMSFLPNTTEPGRIIITTMGTMGGIGLRGQGHFFDIYGRIRSDVPPGTSSEVRLDVVTFYNTDARRQCVDVERAATLRAGGDGLLGDLNGDGVVDIGDALWALRIAVGLESYQSSHIITGDLNGDGSINSADAVLLQRLAADFDYVNPPPLKDGISDPLLLANILDLSMPVTVRVDDEQARVGETFDVAVRVDNAQGLSGYDVTLTFDAGLLEVADVREGTVTGDYPQEWRLSGGVLQVSMGRREALYESEKAIVSATLAVVQFRAKALPAEGDETWVRIESAPAPALKGQYGDSYDWFTRVNRVHGQIILKPGISAEGEFETLEDIAAFLLDNFDVIDMDGDGLLNYEEALGAVADLTRDQFGLLDANGDGLLTREELEAFLADDRCGCCGRASNGKDNLKRHLGDWLLVGLSLLALLTLSSAMRHTRR